MKIRKLLPFIGIIIFIYIIYSIGFQKIFISFSGMKLKYIFLVIIALIAEMLLLTYKWHVIIRLQNFKIKFIKSLKFYLMGNFYGFITPSRVGSLIRATYLKKETGRPLIECGSGIVVERLFDLISLLILSTIGAIYIANYFAGLLTTFILVLVGLIILCIFFASKRRARFALKLFHKFLIPNKLKERVKNSFYEFYDSIPSIKKLVYPFILTLLTWIVAGVFFYTISLMFDINLNLFVFVILNPISIAIGMIPITMSGLGTREATIITLFAIFNIPAELTLAMSLVALVLGAIIPAFIGFLLTQIKR